jgi:pimeloyl-ACP methyl ester carboxylesterase
MNMQIQLERGFA